MSAIAFRVPDMSCGHCASTIRDAVSGVDAVSRCDVDLAAKRVTIESALPAERFAAAIQRAGFTPEAACA